MNLEQPTEAAGMWNRTAEAAKSKRAVARLAIAMAVATLASGCGAPTVEDEYDEENTATQSEALTDPTGGDPFKTWTAGIPILANMAQQDPAFCPAGGRSYLAFARVEGSQAGRGPYKAFAHATSADGRWVDYGSREFVTRPACIMVGSNQFVVVGRAVDGRLYHSDATTVVPAGGGVPDVSPVTAWARISNDTYHGLWGTPSIAFHSDEAVAVVAKDANTLHAYVRYSGGAWSSKYAVDLPSGWSIQGAPTLDYLEGWLHKYMVVLRVRNGSQRRFFFTFFDQYYASGWINEGGGPVIFHTMPTPLGSPTFEGNPAIEYDPNISAATLYARGTDDHIYHTSGSVWDLGTRPFRAIQPSQGIDFSGSPIASSERYDHGYHQVMARDDEGRLRHVEAAGMHVLP